MKTLFCSTIMLCGYLAGTASGTEANALTAGERLDGFEILFNGKDLRGWQPALKSWRLENGPWKVENGAIHFGSRLGFPPLKYCRTAIPPDFELCFEWKEPMLAKPRLQGHFAIGTKGAMRGDVWTGHLFCDYFAADRGVRLVTERISIPIAFAGVSRSMAPSKDAKRPAGEWNRSRMVCRGSLIQQWLNGEKIVDIDLRRDKWLTLKGVPDDILWDHWLTAKRKGFWLEIENSDSECWFRNLKVRAVNNGNGKAKIQSVEARDIPQRVKIIGSLGYPLGTVLDVTGTWSQPSPLNKDDTLRLRVIRVNGKTLKSPVNFGVALVSPGVGAKDVKPIPGESWTMEAYEMGGMIGAPPDIRKRLRSPPQETYGFTFVTRLHYLDIKLRGQNEKRGRNEKREREKGSGVFD